MSSNPNGTTPSQDSRLSNRMFAVNVPMAATFVLFVLGTFMGGEVADRGLLPTVRFLSLIMLGLGMYTAMMTGLRFAYSRKRWLTGQISSWCTGLGAGLLWSGAAFGAGFGFIVIGAVMGALLIAKVFQQRAQKRRLAMQAYAEKAHPE